MAQAKRKSEWQSGVRPTVPAPMERATAIAVPSPARALQQLLEERTGIAPTELRWSRRRAAAFAVTAAMSLWLALLAAAHGTMTMVA